MQRHSNRTAYYVLGEGVISEPPNLFGGPHLDQAESDGQSVAQPPPPPYKFGRMFKKALDLSEPQQEEMIDALKALGFVMNAKSEQKLDSNIPSGYTYLGQFIAHEITFDSTKGLPVVEPDPQSFRSPQIDLDCIYGDGPGVADSAHFYEDDGATLKVGETTQNKSLQKSFRNDLLRDSAGNALIGDNRNDENLPLAQTHVALVKFHNKVVDAIKKKGKGSAPDLFARAQREVRRHFQWIILNDYLPRIVDEKVLDCVLRHGLRCFKVKGRSDLFMPLEFSVAAFRLGHSMIRDRYEWNYYHSTTQWREAPVLTELFAQTRFSGNLSGNPTLLSEWVIDWRRFYDFEGYPYDPAPRQYNVARRIDTNFDLHLDEISGYPRTGLADDQLSITVRNLLRGFAVGLPAGEDVVEALGETLLPRELLQSAEHRPWLNAAAFGGKTPLWYYILKEAEVLKRGVKLGPVGSRIVAETLVGIIANSPDSILRPSEWTAPLYTERQALDGSPRFEMADLLHFADVVNPVGT